MFQDEDQDVFIKDGPAADDWEMSAFTCITCRVAFVDADVQRAHYKTDWHRYNLKRKVADLPPVTAENFQQRVLAQRAQAEEEGKDTASHCTLCNKHFSTENALENHVKSKKHKEAEAKNEEKIKAEVQKRNEKNESKGLEVLAENEKVSRKNAQNEALKDSLEKQEKKQPTASGTSETREKTATGAMDVDGDDSDAESWESWEGDALGEEECLFCSIPSSSLEGNMSHMSTNHSFFIPDIEYLTDLSGLISYLGAKVGEGRLCLWCNEKGRSFPTTKAVQQHMVDKGHCKMLHEGDSLLEYVDFYDYRSSYPDFEQRSGAETKEGERMETEAEEEDMPSDAILEENYQLMLPSGSAIGHRSLQRYYRQKLRPAREGRNPSAVSKVMANYKALGWTGTSGLAAERRAKDMAYFKRVVNRRHLKVAMKANKQQHFRDDNFGIRQ